MAFMVSKAPQSFSESESLNSNGTLSQQESTNGVVSNHLVLKSAGKMDRDVVLRRIRLYKRLNKLRRTFDGLVGGGGGGGSETVRAAADEAESWWLQQYDVFSSG